MIIQYPNNDGYLKGFISFNVIDDNWRLSNDGLILEINGCWIHEDHRNSKFLIEMINDVFVHPSTQKIEYVVYLRDKTGEQKLIPASKFLSFINKEVKNE